MLILLRAHDFLMFIKSAKTLRNKKHWRCDLRVNTDPLALQMWKARRNCFSAATGKHIKRVCSQKPSSWLLHSLIYFLLFLRFCNTWLTIKWLFQHSLIPLEHGEYHSRIPHNGFSTSVLLSLLPRHSVVTCGLQSLTCASVWSCPDSRCTQTQNGCSESWAGRAWGSM